MDPAQEIELNALRFLKPINDAIEHGDSPVQQFYRDTTVFITGGSGFIGKQLIEKLLRACAIKKIYLLSRSKKGRSIEERLQHMLKDPVYDYLRSKQPQFADLIVPVEGDVADIGLGLNYADRHMLANEVNIIFHVAATIRFDEPLRLAVLTNLRGTREVLTLAKECINLKKLVHVSTAFTHATRERMDTDILEQFYPCPVPPEAMIEFAEYLDEKKLESIAAKLIDGWPNTYTFTKALAEELLRTSAGEVPVCIVRPSVVLPSYYEPSPGWLDFSSLTGPSGIVMGIGLGVVHVFYFDSKKHSAVAPVDYVNNATIAAAWDSTERQKNGELEISVYNIRMYMRFGMLSELLHKLVTVAMTPKLVWYSSVLPVNNKLLYLLLSIFLHYIPGYCLDFILALIGRKPKGIPSFIEIYKKMDKLGKVYDYFTSNVWHFKDNNLQAMVERMNAADKVIFNCDINNHIDLFNYLTVWLIGLRKYILKDGLKNTHIGVRKQKIFAVLNFIVLFLYILLLLYVFTMFVKFIKSIILSFCY